MKRALIAPLLLLPLALGCSDGDGADAGVTPDAMPALPDARVVTFVDSGAEMELPKPTLNGVSPGSGTEAGGTRVTLRGTSFLEPAQVFIGGAPATSVVVLDEVSIAATTPPGTPGGALVKVVTPGGEAELPDGFRYHRELVITEVRPARIPDEGGVEVEIVGRGFDENTIVLLDRQPLAGATLVDAEHLRGWAPALAPGRPEVRAFHREAEARRSDVLFVYGTPDVRQVAPGYGAITGGAYQEIDGAGFEGAERVFIGGVLATELESLAAGTRLRVRAPALPAGIHEVRVENSDASGSLAGAYVAYDPGRVGFEIVGAVPRALSSAGGELVTIAGYGFRADAQVEIGGVAATVLEVRGTNVLLAEAPALAVGLHALTVRVPSAGSSGTLPDVFEVYDPIEVQTIDPATGPVAGGTEVRIGGKGFVPGVQVTIGGVPLRDVLVEGPNDITGVTVAGAHGPQDVVVKSAFSRGVLAGGFRYEDDFAVVRLEPTEGSLAGNTYVSVLGKGFDAPVTVSFGGTAGVSPRLENGSVIGVRTAPAAMSGRVDVVVTTPRGEVTLPRAFGFYDPKLLTGGGWGGPVEGSVNVAVLDIDTGDPMPGMVVQLGHDADLRYAAITDERGLATISSPEIRGPQTVTAGQNGVQFVTFAEVNTRNLSMFASRYPASPPPDQPIQPCPMGQEPPRVRGKVFKFKSSLDGQTQPGWVPVAFITYTQRNVFSPNPPMPPEQETTVQSEGEEYEIVIMRAGTVAVYAFFGDFNVQQQLFIPRRMGVARQVPAAVGVVTEGIDIALDIELDKDLVVRLDNPPNQRPGPSLNAVFPFLNLDSEGVVPFPPTAVLGPSVTLTRMPNLAASQFFYMGGSFTQGANGGLQAPYSLSLLESGAPFEVGLDMGPFLQMPQNVEPKPANVLVDGRLSWDQGGPQPNITTIEVLDAEPVEGACCDDQSGNGQCEPNEPVMGGVQTVQYSRWSLFGPGGLESYRLPPMVSGLNAFDTPNRYFWLVQEAIAPRFNYGEFIYNNFSPFFWTSWNVWFSDFVAKEQTP